MKRFFVMLVLLAGISIVARAQFNKTYTLSGLRLWGSSIALPNNAAGTKDIVVCSPAMAPTSNTINRCMLMKTDDNGNVLTTKLRDTSNGLERVIETIDNGVLLASVFGDKIVVTKYDNNLNQLWSYKSTQNPDQFGAFGPATNLDIEKVYYPNNPPNDQEYYYIVYAAGPANAIYNQDANVGVMKIHQNGTLAWHRVYYDANRASYGTNAAVRDLAHSITSFPSPGNPNLKYLAISGARDYYDAVVIRKTTIFSFEIDENGSIMTPYKNITTGGGEPLGPDIMWDGTNLVITYVEKNTGINPGPNNASGVGLMRFSTSYASPVGKYYWSKCENYGLSLSMSSDGNYIVGGWQSYCGLPFDASSMLFKINKTTLNQMYCMQYNVLDNYAANGSHRTDNANSNYILGASSDVRLIKTNALGLACGNAGNTMQFKNFTPSIQNLTYVSDPNPNYTVETISDMPVTPTMRDCATSGGSGASYRMAAAGTTPSGPAISVYPTQIDHGDELITCKIPEHKSAAVEIAVYNVLGRKIYLNSYKADNTDYIQFNSSVLEPGLNIISISSGNQHLSVAKVNVVR